MRTERFTFEGSQGGALAARLDLPARQPRGTALFAHCFTCSKDSVAAARIARGLVAADVGVLRFDFTGLGSSEGEFANTNFASNVEDVVAAAGALRGRFEGAQILIGHSLGGTAVLVAAAQLPEVAAVVTINAPYDPAHVLRALPDEAVSELERNEEVGVEIAGRPFRIRRQFLVAARSQDMGRAIGSLGRPLLVLHAPTDELVSIDNARRIFEAARHPKSFVSLDDADHLLTGAADGAYPAEVIAAWASRYVAHGREAERAEATPEGTVVVTESGRGHFEQVVRAGRHVLVADEPAGVGDDAGPDPYDLLLAALGTCTSMTLRMYADHKQWPLEGVEVRLTHRRVHAEDCRDCEVETSMVDEIERVIDLAGSLTQDQQARLLEIAERCPVHRTLIGTKRIVTRLAGALA